MPDVQYPHWVAGSAASVRWTGCSRSPAGPASPSIVVTERPATSPALVRQARTGAPSTRTVHALQAPSPQPGLAR
jgi:hypothetical protein